MTFSAVLIIFYSVGKHGAPLDLVLGTYGTNKPTASVFSVQPPWLFSSPSLLPPLCRDVIIPPLSTSDLRASVCILCVRDECSVTAWWSERLCAAYCVAQFTDNVSRWMPPFTNTASPLAAALSALLLSFLVPCEGGKKAIKMGQKQAATQVVYLENKKRNNRKWCLQSAHSFLEQSQPNFISLDCCFSKEEFPHKRWGLGFAK